MENIGLGAGLGAIGFWGFIAACVVAYYWDSIRKRESQHETLRRMMEGGQPINETLMNKILSLDGSGSENLARDLKVSGLIMLPLAPGMAILGWFLSLVAEDAFYPLLGVSALMVCISAGLLLAAKAAQGPDVRDRS